MYYFLFSVVVLRKKMHDHMMKKEKNVDQQIFHETGASSFLLPAFLFNHLQNPGKNYKTLFNVTLKTFDIL